MSATTIGGVEQVCKRFGPGRLPRADDRMVGAGYAFASAALAAAGLYVVLGFTATVVTPGPSAPLRPTLASPAFVGLAAIPFVVPTAFVAGSLTWRVRPEQTPYSGALCGMGATLLTYVGAALLVGGYALVYTGLQPDQSLAVVNGSGQLVDALGLSLLVGIFGFSSTFWLTLPVGAVSGYIHERAVADATTDGDSAPDAATDGPGTSGGQTDEHGLQAEEQVERLLLRNGGRMTGADIVEATGWSEAEVAEAVSILAAADRIERHHEDGDTVICYPME